MASQSRSAASSEQVQTALSRVLLQKIRQDHHPSYTQMTLLEQVIPPSLYREYVTVLLEKVVHDNRPSTTVIRRIQGFASQIP